PTKVIPKQRLHESLINDSRYLAEAARAALNGGDLALAIRVARRALPSTPLASDRPYVSTAEAALAASGFSHGELLSTGWPEPAGDSRVEEFTSVRYARDSSLLFTAGRGRGAGVWNAFTGGSVYRLLPELDSLSLGLSDDEQLLTITSWDGKVG